MGVAVQPYSEKIFAKIYAGRAEFVETEKQHHRYVDDKQSVDEYLGSFVHVANIV